MEFFLLKIHLQSQLTTLKIKELHKKNPLYKKFVNLKKFVWR